MWTAIKRVRVWLLAAGLLLMTSRSFMSVAMGEPTAAFSADDSQPWTISPTASRQLLASVSPASPSPLYVEPISSNTRNSEPFFMSEVAQTLASEEDEGNSADDLAKKLANPVASLISIPLQSNFDFGGGPNHEGWRYILNVQPVIPLNLNDDWNLIIRTIVPVIYQNKLVDTHDQFGLGDTNQSFFFSPAKPGPGGLVWGVGPVYLYPTSTDSSLGAHRWGLGPTGLVLVQQGPWTYGILANHIFSIGHNSFFNGEDGIADVSSTCLQPFLSYSLGHGTSLTLNTETTYNWTSSKWTVPINLMVSQVIPIAGHPVSFSVGARDYATGPQGTPEWGFRFAVTFLFPEK